MPNLQTQAQIGVVSATLETTSGYFVQVPVELLKSDLSSSALRLYLVLLSYGGPKSCAWPGQARLATDLKLSERRVRDLLTELEATGLIQIEHVAGTSNLYHLHRFELRGLPGKKEIQKKEAIEATPAEKCQKERQKSATELHVLELNNMCEGKVLAEKARKEDETSDSLLATIEKEFILAGLTSLMASELAEIALNNKRDQDYVKGLVTASRERGIHNPVGFIRFMVLRNSDPISPKPRSKPEKPNPTQPIDFAKYTSGKYAYLTNCKDIVVNEPELPIVEPLSPSSVQPDAPQKEVVSRQPVRPEYRKLRQVMAETFGLENEKVLTEWEKVLETLADCPQNSYFYPALGWLERVNEVKCYRLVFRNRFDLKLGQRYLPQLRMTLLATYGLDLAIDCQSLT